MPADTLKDRFEDSCPRYTNKIALRFLRNGEIETELTYREMIQDIDSCAAVFLDMGIVKGDRVVLFLNKSVLFVIAHIALQKIGAISVPLNPGFKKSEMDYLLKDADPKLVIGDTDKNEMISKILPNGRFLSVDTDRRYQEVGFFRSVSPDTVQVNIDPQDPGLIIYTSGTTGNPKGVVLTHRNLINDAKNIIQVWELSETDLLCHALPLYHIHGLCFALHSTLLAGGGVILLDRFDPETTADILSHGDKQWTCTVFMAVPTIYKKLINTLEEKQFNFSHIRLWTSGSAPLLEKDFKKISEAFGKEPVEREGMSETGMNFSNPLHGKRKPGSVGLPLPGLHVRIVDPNTLSDVQKGEIGEFWLKSFSITPGYWRKPLETSEVFVDGWFRTGDLGRVDEDGYYYLTDRIKHIIITGGENVSAKEVETVIDSMVGVEESSVVGIPDERWGEKVVAAVVTKPGHLINRNEIVEFCKARLHNWKCPKEILFIPEIPKNTMGKVLKENVKSMFTNTFI